MVVNGNRLRRTLTLLLLGMAIGAVLVGMVMYIYSSHDTPKEKEVYREIATPNSPELLEISRMQGGFDVIAPYFKELAEKKGASYAFQILRMSPMPPNLDIHLLGHTIGDELYKQQGVAGISLCTNEFRNACSHSLVVGALIDEGESALPVIAETCKKAPGGSGAYTMCFHGLGHGILAYFAYELPEAIEMCKRVGTPAYHGREYIECVGGVIMELIGGGGHDKTTFDAISPKFFKTEDPLYPCNAEFMPIESRPQCYTYLTPHLFKVAGADLGRPEPKHLSRAFQFCDVLPKNGPFVFERSMCYGGFGKEFVVLAQDRDIRKIGEMTNEQLSRVISWCALANDSGGVTDCQAHALQSLYWGGENTPDVSLRFCAILQSGAQKDACYQGLIGAVASYVSDVRYREEFCVNVPSEFATDCKHALLPR